MAHFAELDENNIVKRVIVVSNNAILDDSGKESEAKGVAFCQSLFGGRWVQTSYNNKFRKQFAGIGGRYDSANDVFIAPKPYPSWVFNQSKFDWEPPVPCPNDGMHYIWQESTVSWVSTGMPAQQTK
jgi:hypothetical protein